MMKYLWIIAPIAVIVVIAVVLIVRAVKSVLNKLDDYDDDDEAYDFYDDDKPLNKKLIDAWVERRRIATTYEMYKELFYNQGIILNLQKIIGISKLHDAQENIFTIKELVNCIAMRFNEAKQVVEDVTDHEKARKKIPTNLCSFYETAETQNKIDRICEDIISIKGDENTIFINQLHNKSQDLIEELISVFDENIEFDLENFRKIIEKLEIVFKNQGIIFVLHKDIPREDWFKFYNYQDGKYNLPAVIDIYTKKVYYKGNVTYID